MMFRIPELLPTQSIEERRVVVGTAEDQAGAEVSGPAKATGAPQPDARPDPHGPPPARHDTRWARRKVHPRQAAGWVAASVDAKPIRVSVYINDLEVVSGWATSARAEPTSKGELQYFALRIEGIWEFCGVNNRLTVRADGVPLPITDHGMYPRPAEAGAAHPQAAARADGQGLRVRPEPVSSSYPRSSIPSGRKGSWALHRRRAIVSEAFGYDVFLTYGSLLGAVREGGFIGHDLDFDSAYVSKHTTGADAARELRDIALLLIDRGRYDVDGWSTHLHVHPIGDPVTRIDLFHHYFNAAGRMGFPFGFAGDSVIEASDWQGTRRSTSSGTACSSPPTPSRSSSTCHGSDWRVPQPGFDWVRDRTDRASEALMPPGFGQTVYWAKF